MRYTDYRDSIAKALQRNPRGLTWAQLQAQLKLPYERPCPAWTNQLAKDIALTRTRNGGRAMIWQLKPRAKMDSATHNKINK
jgi:hypothetical protein